MEETLYNERRSGGGQPIASYQQRQRIRWIDTDASGFVKFGTYIRLMEETEYSFLRSRGLSVVLHDDRGTMGFPRISASLSVRKPVVFDDEIMIHLDLVQIDGKQIRYHFKIRDSSQRPSGAMVATGEFLVACCRFPPDQLPFAILTPEFVIEKLLGSE